MHSDLKDLGLVLLAAFLSAIVGLEREKKGKPAGFRTHMFIGGSSALLVLVGHSLALTFPRDIGPESLRIDPLRLLEAIIVGVSFIGAGTILKNPDQPAVKNLTSAATLLFSAGIGVCVAIERIVLAIGVVVAALMINTLMKKVEDRWIS